MKQICTSCCWGDFGQKTARVTRDSTLGGPISVTWHFGVQHYSKRRSWEVIWALQSLSVLLYTWKRFFSVFRLVKWGFSAETVPGWYFVDSFKLQSWWWAWWTLVDLTWCGKRTWREGRWRWLWRSDFPHHWMMILSLSTHFLPIDSVIFCFPFT